MWGKVGVFMIGDVLFVCETYPPQTGGLARAAQRISEAVSPHCRTLRRLCLDRQLSPAQARWDEEHSMIRLGPLPDEEETWQLVEQFVAHLQPLDLVHSFYAGQLGSAAVLAAGRRGLPSLVSLRGNDLDRGVYRAKTSSLLRLTLEHATAITCVSREQVHKLSVWFGRKDGHYIANSVDGQAFYPDTPLSDLGELPIVAFVGEMRWKKGLALLLEVAAQTRGEFRLAVVGGIRRGDKAAAGAAALRDLMVLPYQHDRGWLRRLYCRADLVWLPALWEGMPNALLEAMACQRPVLAHRVGGIADLLPGEEGELGWTLGLADTQRTLECMGQILGSPEVQRRAVGERARRHVLLHHQPQEETDSYLKLYRQLLAQ